MSMNASRFAGSTLALALVLWAGCAPHTVEAEDTALSEASSSSQAPEWKVPNLDGGTVSSAEFKGKVLVVDFWATWCGPCVSEIPGYIELQKKYAAQGLVFVGLSIDEAGPDVVRKFVKAHKINYAIGMADSDVQTAFGGFEAIPTTFVIDREGRIRHKKTGAANMSDFEAILKPLLK